MCVAAGDVCVRLHRDDTERHFANRASGESDGAHAVGETSNDDKYSNDDKSNNDGKIDKDEKIDNYEKIDNEFFFDNDDKFNNCCSSGIGGCYWGRKGEHVEGVPPYFVGVISLLRGEE